MSRGHRQEQQSPLKHRRVHFISIMVFQPYLASFIALHIKLKFTPQNGCKFLQELRQASKQVTTPEHHTPDYLQHKLTQTVPNSAGKLAIL